MAMIINASSFKDFSRDLRARSPELSRQMRKEIRAVGTEITRKMKAECPHPDSGATSGIRFSAALASGGAGIVIGANSPGTKSYAFTFGVGQPSRLGHYKHKVFGKWSSSTATIMPISDYIVRNWAEMQPMLQEACEVAMAVFKDLLAMSDD